MQFDAENWPKASVFDDLGSGLSQLQSLLEEWLYSSFTHFSPNLRRWVKLNMILQWENAYGAMEHYHV